MFTDELLQERRENKHKFHDESQGRGVLEEDSMNWQAVLQ